MSNVTDTIDNTITDYKAAFNAYKFSRNSLLQEIAGYSGLTNKGVIMTNSAHKQYWIIFIKQAEPLQDNGQYYDLNIKGTGLHVTLDTQINSQTNFLNWCNSYDSTSNIMSKLSKFEFHGNNPENYMKIDSVIQKGTVRQNDDIAEIGEITAAQFENLCNGIAAQPSAMPF